MLQDFNFVSFAMCFPRKVCVARREIDDNIAISDETRYAHARSTDPMKIQDFSVYTKAKSGLLHHTEW